MESFYDNVLEHDKEVFNDRDQLEEVWEVMAESDFVCEIVSEHARMKHDAEFKEKMLDMEKKQKENKAAEVAKEKVRRRTRRRRLRRRRWMS